MESSLALSAPPPLASMLANVSLFLDFDGTLVDLAPGPDAIQPRPNLAGLLGSLAERLGGRCAIVSGRAIADIEKHIGPLPIAAAGSHGSDIRAADGSPLGAGPACLPTDIEKALRTFAADAGLDYEHKPHGGALHYRRNPDRGPQAHAFAKDLARSHGWAVQTGKCVVEIVAADANKGSAVHSLMTSAGFVGSLPVFIGDDLTDEKGFAACDELGGYGILVGERGNTCARHVLPDVATVHTWLGIADSGF